MASEVGTVAVSTQRVPAADTATDWLWRRAHDVIEAYLATRGKADFARSVKSMTDQTVHEYGGRFLHELVQNGYDAHPADRSDGQVTLRLDCTEGPHGVLYVANAGRGFSESNVRAISNLGLSDKTIGEGIGNKGRGLQERPAGLRGPGGLQPHGRRRSESGVPLPLRSSERHPRPGPRGRRAGRRRAGQPVAVQPHHPDH